MVHVQGKHHSGGFVVLISSLISGESLETILEEYLQDDYLRPHDRKVVLRALAVEKTRGATVVEV